MEIKFSIVFAPMYGIVQYITDKQAIKMTNRDKNLYSKKQTFVITPKLLHHFCDWFTLLEIYKMTCIVKLYLFPF